jgi:hypothetical protein
MTGTFYIREGGTGKKVTVLFIHREIDIGRSSKAKDQREKKGGGDK